MNKFPHTLVLLMFSLIALIVLTIGFHAILGTTPPGADNFTFWLAGRAIFLEGNDPYSNSVTLDSQLGIYGAPALEFQDQVAFAYPPYILLPLIPTFWMDFSWAVAFWLALNLLIILNLFLLLFPRNHFLLSIGYIFFYPVAFGLILGNFAVLIGSIFLFFFGAVVNHPSPSQKNQILAGILLAWTTAKPQFVWFFLLFFALIAIRRHLWPLVYSFLISFATLLLSAFIMVPNWPSEWINRIQQYSVYVQSRPTITNLLDFFLPEPLAWTGTFLLALILFFLTCYLFAGWFKEKFLDVQLLVWVGLITYLYHLHGISYEQITLVVPLTCWVVIQRNIEERKAIILWLGFFIITWFSFTISKWLIPEADEWPVVFFAFFSVWLNLSKGIRKKKLLDMVKI